MDHVHLLVGIAVLVTSLAAGAWGTWCWWRVIPSRVFWPLVRTSQALLVAQVALGGILLALGREPSGELHLLYGLLPLGVTFIAEQLRVASAETILDQRGIPDAQAVGRLPEREQRLVVLDIVRRETGVMAAASLVVFFLALRAADVSGGLPLPI